MIANVNFAHFTDRRELFANRIPLSSVRTVLTDRKTVNTHSCHENILSPTNEMRFTDRKTLFTDRIPLLSIRSIRMDRQTVYNYSSHENILSPTYEMRLTNRKTHFTDRIPLLWIPSICTDRHMVYTDRYGAGVLDNPPEIIRTPNPRIFLLFIQNLFRLKTYLPRSM